MGRADLTEGASESSASVSAGIENRPLLTETRSPKRYGYSSDLIWSTISFVHKKKGIPWLESVSELYRPSDPRLSVKSVLTFEDSAFVHNSVLKDNTGTTSCLHGLNYEYMTCWPIVAAYRPT
jgi:hypothetical protein